MKFLAWTIWYVGAHIPLVTCVQVYFLVILCLEDNWRFMLTTKLAMGLFVGLATSLASTAAFMVSGLAVYRQRFGRAVAWMVASVVFGLVTALTFVMDYSGRLS